jgi:hypothetical protein
MVLLKRVTPRGLSACSPPPGLGRLWGWSGLVWSGPFSPFVRSVILKAGEESKNKGRHNIRTYITLLAGWMRANLNGKQRK